MNEWKLSWREWEQVVKWQAGKLLRSFFPTQASPSPTILVPVINQPKKEKKPGSNEKLANLVKSNPIQSRQVKWVKVQKAALLFNIYSFPTLFLSLFLSFLAHFSALFFSSECITELTFRLTQLSTPFSNRHIKLGLTVSPTTYTLFLSQLTGFYLAVRKDMMTKRFSALTHPPLPPPLSNQI